MREIHVRHTLDGVTLATLVRRCVLGDAGTAFEQRFHEAAMHDDDVMVSPWLAQADGWQQRLCVYSRLGSGGGGGGLPSSSSLSLSLLGASSSSTGGVDDTPAPPAPVPTPTPTPTPPPTTPTPTPTPTTTPTTTTSSATRDDGDGGGGSGGGGAPTVFKCMETQRVRMSVASDDNDADGDGVDAKRSTEWQLESTVLPQIEGSVACQLVSRWRLRTLCANAVEIVVDGEAALTESVWGVQSFVEGMLAAQLERSCGEWVSLARQALVDADAPAPVCASADAAANAAASVRDSAAAGDAARPGNVVRTDDGDGDGDGDANTGDVTARPHADVVADVPVIRLQHARGLEKLVHTFSLANVDANDDVDGAALLRAAVHARHPTLVRTLLALDATVDPALRHSVVAASQADDNCYGAVHSIAEMLLREQ